MTIRNVIDFAHEVRIHLHDAQVIFGSVTRAANAGAKSHPFGCSTPSGVPQRLAAAPAGDGETGSFRIKPWGLATWMAIQFDDVSLAAPVKQMGWQRHRAIAAAQQAGIFTGKSKP
jgi:hypothetical protein